MIWVREHRFETLQECADYFGVTVAYVRDQVNAQRTDRIGLGSAGKGQKKNNKKFRMPVLVRGVLYKSAAECAKKLRVSVSTVYAALSKGTQDTLGLGCGGVKKRYGGGRSTPVTLVGVTFPSKAAASRALGHHEKWLEQVLRERGAIQMQHLEAAVVRYLSTHSPKQGRGKKPKTTISNSMETTYAE